MPRGISPYDNAFIQSRTSYNAITSAQGVPNLVDNNFTPSGNVVPIQQQDLVANGLVFYLDAGIGNSYPRSGIIWNDLSGNRNNGTLVNLPTYSSGNGGLLSFNGSSQQCSISNPSVLRNQNFSVSLWLRPRTQAAAITSILDFDHAGSPNQGWVIQSEDATTNRFYYLAWHNGSSFQPAGGFGSGRGIQLVNNVWQNITYVKNGTILIGYSNGVSVYTPSAAVNANVNYITGRNMMLANAVSVTTRRLNADIGLVQIYSRGLSAEEVVQNFNTTRTRFEV